jgi:hypothetical protein
LSSVANLSRTSCWVILVQPVVVCTSAWRKLFLHQAKIFGSAQQLRAARLHPMSRGAAHDRTALPTYFTSLNPSLSSM